LCEKNEILSDHSSSLKLQLMSENCQFLPSTVF